MLENEIAVHNNRRNRLRRILEKQSSGYSISGSVISLPIVSGVTYQWYENDLPIVDERSNSIDVSGFDVFAIKCRLFLGDVYFDFYQDVDSFSDIPTPALSTTASYTSVVTNWTVSEEIYIENYVVEYKRSIDSTWLEVGTVSAPTKTYTITGLSYNTQYDIRVKALNSYNSVYSSIQNSTTLSNIILNDTFTDADNTSLISHTSNSLHSWLVQAGVTTPPNHSLIFNNRLYSRSTFGVYRANLVMPNSNYEVEMVFFVVTRLGIIGVTARSSSVQRTNYSWFYRDSVGWTLQKIINGVTTPLGTFSTLVTVGQTVTAKIVVSNSSIQGWINESPVVSAVDTDITSAGSPGVTMPSVVTSTTGMHMDSVITRLI